MAFLKRVANYFSKTDTSDVKPSLQSTGYCDDSDSIYLKPESVQVIHEKHKKLGEGTFAKVYEGRYGELPCAVKVFKENNMVKKFQNGGDDNYHDMLSLCDLKAPNIINIYGLWFDPHKDRNALSLVMELCDTSLHDHIAAHKARKIPNLHKLKILHDVTNAMIYLHEEQIVHGDLRSPNVLLVNTRSREESTDEQPLITAKVADFDLARHIDPTTLTRYTTTFTDEDFLPPEAIDDSETIDKPRKHVRLTLSVDVFCFGPIAIELACMEFPKPAVKVIRKKGQPIKVLDEIERRDKYLKKIDFSERMCTDLIVKQCMAERPEARGSFLDLQVIIEAFQKKMSERPDQQLLAEQQAELYELRRKMEEDTETLAETESLKEQLQKMNISMEELKEKLQRTEKDLEKANFEMFFQKQACEESQRSLNSSTIELGRKEGEIQRIQRDLDSVVASNDSHYREALKLKDEKLNLSTQLQELRQNADQQKIKLQDLENQLPKLERVIKDGNRERLNLKQELEKSERLCNKLKKYEEESKELKKINDNSKKLKTQLEGEKRKLTEAEEAKTMLNAKLAKAEKLLEETKVQFESEVKQLKVDLQESKDEETALELMLTNAQQSREDVKKHLDCERSKWDSEREQLRRKHAVAVIGKYLLIKVKNRRTAVHLQTKLSEDSADELKEIRDKMKRLKDEFEHERSQWDVEQDRLAKEAAVVKKQMSTTIEDLRAENEQSLKDRDSALKERVELKQSIELLEETVESKKKEVDGLQAALQHEKEEVQRLASKIRDSKEHTLKKERQRLEQECKEIEKRRADAEKEFKKQCKTHTEEKKTLEKERDDLKGEKSTLNRKIKLLQDDLTDIKTKLSCKQKEFTTAENEVKNLKANLKKMERTETLLRKSVEEERHSREAAVIEMKKERQKSEQECKEIEKRRADAEKEFKIQCKSHLEEKKTLEKERDELKGEKTTMNKSIDSLKKELAELKPKLSSKQQELATVEKEVMELRANLRKSEKTETSLRKDLVEEKLKFKESQKHEENLSQSLHGLQRAKTVVEDQLHKLEEERDTAVENVRELKNKLASKAVEYDNSVSQFTEKLQTSKRNHSKQNLGLMDKCSKMETQLKDLEQEKEQVVQKLKEQLKDEVQEKERAVQRKEEMRLKVDDLEKAKEQTEKLALLLENEVGQKKEEFKRYECTVKELKEKLDDSMKQHDELKRKWEELTRHSEDDKKSLQTKEEEYEAVKKTLHQKEKQLHEMKESNSQTDDEKSTRILNLEEKVQHYSEELQKMENKLTNQKDLLSKQKNKTESEKEDLQNKINRLNQANAKLKSDCDKELQLVEHRGNEQIEKLKRKAIHLEDKLSRKENDLHQKQREVDVMSEKAKESQELFEKEKETKQQKIADCRRLEHELMLEKKHHKEMTEEYHTKISHLEDEKENLLKEMANLEEAGNRLVQDKGELEIHVAKLEEQLVKMEADIKALKGNRDKLVDEKEHLQGMVTDLKAEKTNLTSRVADLRREKGELLEERMCLEEKVTEASKKCDGLQESCLFLEENYSKLEQEHRNSLQANEEKINLLKEVVSETQLKLQESQTDCDSTLKLTQKLQADLDKSNGYAKKLKVMNDQLDAKVEQWKIAEHALNVTVSRKDRELAQLTLEVTDFKGKFDGVRVQHQDLIDKFETLAIEKEEYQKKYEELTHVDEKLELERNDLEKKVKDLEVCLSESVTKAKLLDGEMTERTSEMENLRGERDSLKQALCEYKKKLSKCSVTLDETRVKLAYFEGEYERIQSECTQVQKEKKKIKEKSLHREKVLTQQLHHMEEVTAIKQLAIEKLWVESFVDKCFYDTVGQMSKDQFKKVFTNLEDTKSELNNTKDKLIAVTTTLAEEAQKFQQLQYQESCHSELLSSTEEDLRKMREKCARYRNEVADLENAQMVIAVQKDAIQRDLVVLRNKNEQCQKELSHHQSRFLVVERDLRQAKDAGNQLRAQCETLKVRNKTVEEENTILHRALEAQTLSSVQLRKENTQLKELKKQEKQIKSQRQSLKQGRKVLQQDMVDLEKKKASLEGKEELLREERNLMTRQCLEDDKKLKIEQFRHLREEQLVVVDKMCNKIEKSFREQQKTQKQHFEGIVQEIDIHHTKQSEEQEFMIKSLEQSGASVIRGLQRELYNAKVKVELFDTAVQKVSKPLSADVQVNPDILDLLQKFEIVCKLLNCYEPRVLDVRNSGFCQPPEEMGSKCDLDSFKVFDVCKVQYLDYQFKLPFAVENFVQSFQEHRSGPSIVCSLPFIVYTDVVCFCNLLVATSPFLITADPKDVLRMEPTLVCILAKTALTGDLEQNLIRCQKGWKNISKGLIFHPTWCGQEPNKPITLKHPPVNLPVKLEPVLEQLKLMTARKLHALKPELVRSLCQEQRDQ